jgi:ATP-dependent protease ClpP protease subunit
MKFIYKLIFLPIVLGVRNILLGNHNFVNLIGPITTTSVDSIIMDWNQPYVTESIKKYNTTILYINSPGGSVHAGNHLIEYMKSLQERNIVIECIGQNFMSMAFVVFQACDHRMVLSNSIGMQHQMSFHLKGDIENIRTAFHLHDTINEKIIKRETTRINITRQDYQQKIDHDWWIFGEDNILENTADEIVLLSCSPDILNMVQVRQEKMSHYTFYVYNHKCPLFKDVQVTEDKFKKYFDSDFYTERRLTDLFHL